MPQLGESVAEGTVVRWLKRVGDAVALDEPLFEVASDKVNMEIPSLNAGRLAEILVPEGATVDVGTPVARIESADDAVAPARAPHRTPGGRNGERRSPVVRRLAREHQLDLAQIPGTGSHGRVTRNDVLAYLDARAAAASAAPASPPARAASVAPLPLRAKIAANVLASKQQTADVFSVMEVDMENVLAVRTARKDAFKAKEGASLTYLPFIARATIDALRAYPAVNARFAGGAVVHNAAVHLGIAVDLDERGLIVPVIRNADSLNVTGLARATAALSSAARAGTAFPPILALMWPPAELLFRF